MLAHLDKDAKELMIIGGVAALALYFISKNAGGIAQALVKGAGGAIVDTATGAVIGAGEAIGIPETNLTQCEIDLANGDKWAASFSCPAGTFFKSFF